MRRKDEIQKQLQKPKLFRVEDLLRSNVERIIVVEGGILEIVAFIEYPQALHVPSIIPITDKRREPQR